MASSNVFWGIEIGAASIKAIKLERAEDNKVKVLDFAIIPHPKPLSTPGVDAADVLRVSLGTLTNQIDLSKAGLAVSVPGHAAFARFTKLPPVAPNKVPDIVKFEAMQQIPFPLDQVEWDYQTFVATDSPDVGVGIFAITKEKVNERLTLLQDVGLNPDILTLSPLAAYNALAYDLEFNEKTPGTIIVDIGTTSTDIVIAEPGRMWVRTFQIGGHQFTDALVQQFQLSYPKAEKLKREAEDTKHARQVFQAMRPVFTDLATEVQRSIGYYQALHKDSKLQRLIGVGSTFQLPGLRKYFKQQLSIEVYRVEEFKKAKFAGEREGAFNEAALNLVTAYGLALQGLELNACGGNLMPVSIMREAMWRGKTKYFAAAAGIAVAAGAAMFFRPIYDHFQVIARPPDPTIERVLSRVRELQSEATEAGVTGQAQQDLSAANMVELLTRRGVYAHIANDLGLIFDAADRQASIWGELIKTPGEAAPKIPDPPAFSLGSFTTDYEPPRPQDEDGTEPGYEPVMQAGPKLPPAIMELARVKCVLKVTTDMPEPRRFVTDSVKKWLEANRKRDGVPYELYTQDPVFTLAEYKPIQSTIGAGGRFGDPMGGPRAAGRRAFSDRNMPTNPNEAQPDDIPPPDEREPTMASGAGEGVVASNPATEAMNLDTNAPLIVPGPDAGKNVVTIVWWAVIPKPVDAAQEGKN